MINLLFGVLVIVTSAALLFAAINIISPRGYLKITSRKRAALLLLASFIHLSILTGVASDADNGQKIGAITVYFALLGIYYLIYWLLQDKPSTTGKAQKSPTHPAPKPGMGFEYPVRIMGVYYRQDNAEDFMTLTQKYIRLEKEPDNAYDSRAIKVIGGGIENGHKYEYHLGYIPKEHSIALYQIKGEWGATASYDYENDIFFDPDEDEYDLHIVLHIQGITRKEYRRLVRKAYDLRD